MRLIVRVKMLDELRCLLSSRLTALFNPSSLTQTAGSQTWDHRPRLFPSVVDDHFFVTGTYVQVERLFQWSGATLCIYCK